MIPIQLVAGDGQEEVGTALAPANVTVVQGNDGHLYEKIDDYVFRQIHPPTVHVTITPADH